MGNTGNANGEHLHFEIYEGGSTGEFRVNPLSRTYVYEGQIVSDSSKKKVLYFITTEKTLDEVANDVIKGLYGNQPNRKINLEKEEYNYSDVQIELMKY